eukprot:jgi/Psemu1/69421/estExt_Genemark1.C_8480015
MKFSVAIALLLPALASAFAPTMQVTRAASSLSSAKSFEEDLEKTRQVILSFMDGEDGAEPVEEVAEAETDESEEAAQEIIQAKGHPYKHRRCYQLG